MKKELIVNDECLDSKLHFLNHSLYYIYISFFSSKSKDICLTFRIKFRYFIEFLQKCHSRFLFYFVYIDRSFARQFSLHELHSIIRDTHRSF